MVKQKRKQDFVMTPEQFYTQMRAIQLDEDLSNDDQHERMDKLMCQLLSDLGYTDGIEIFKNTEKWYW